MFADRTARTALLSIAVIASVGALSGCEIVEPAESSSDGTDNAGAPPRPVGSVCNVSPALVAGAPAQVSGAFCFGVAVSSGDFLLCEQRDASTTVCVDEVVGLAYLVRWAGSSGAVYDLEGRRQLGGIQARARQTYEVATAQGQALRATGVCSLELSSGVSVARYCPYTN